MSIITRLKNAVSLTLRAVEFGYYHVLLSAVDRVSRLPRNTTVPEAMRLYRENIALKAQLDALEAELAQRTQPAPVPMATRASQVFAYFLTRGDEPFQRYFLSASLRTIKRWATRFRSLRRRPNMGGRPPLDEKVIELIVTLKRENRAWGHRRIREELRRMGIRVSEPTMRTHPQGRGMLRIGESVPTARLENVRKRLAGQTAGTHRREAVRQVAS